MSGDKLTRKDFVEDDIFNIGKDYADSLEPAKKATKEWLETTKKAVLELEKLSKSTFKASSLTEIENNRKKGIEIIEKQTTAEEKLIQSRNVLNRTAEKGKIIEDSLGKSVKNQTTNTKKHIKTTQILNRVYTLLNTKYTRLNKLAQEAGAKHGFNSKQFKKASREAKKYKIRIDNISNSIKNGRLSLSKYNLGLGNSFKLLRNLTGALGVFAGATAFRQIFNEVKELDGLNKALQKVTETTEQFIETKSFLKRTSDAYGVEIKTNTKELTKFLAGLKGTNLEGQKGIDIYEKTIKVSASLGRSQEQISGTLNALTQIISKGTVQAEELRGQLGDRLPGAFNIMARAIGVSVEELNKMLKNGEVIADEVLPKFANELEKTFGLENVNRVETLEAATNRLNNSWISILENLEGGESRVSKFFIFMVDGIAKITKGFGYLTQSTKDWKSELSESLENEQFKNEQRFIREEAERTGKTLEEIAKNEKEIVKKRLDNTKSQIKSTEEAYGTLEEINNNIDKNAYGTNTGNYILAKTRLENLTRQATGYAGELRAVNSFLPDKPIGTGENPKKPTDTELKALKQKKEQQLKLEIEYQKLFAQQRQINLEDELKKESLTAIEKIKIADKLYKAKGDILRLSTKKKLVGIDKGTQAELNIFRDAEIKAIKLKQDYSKVKEQIVKDEFDKKIKLIKQEKEAEEKEIADLIALEAKKLKENNVGATNEEKIANLKAYEEAVLKIKREYAIKQIQVKINKLKALQKEDLTLEQQKLVAKQIADAKIAISNIETGAIVENVKKQIEAEKKLQETRFKVVSEISNRLGDALDLDAQNIETFINKSIDVFTKGIGGAKGMLEGLAAASGLVSDIGNGIFEANIAHIDNEIEANNRKYDEAITKAQDRYDEEGNLIESRELTRKILEEKKQKEEAELEKKKKKEQIKQAKFNKALKIVDIGIATALGIMQAYAQLGPIAGSVAAVLVGTLGTIQTAAVIASPIPQFKDGYLEGKYEGPAITNDGVDKRGRTVQEFLERGNKIFPIKGKNTRIQMKMGDKIHKDANSVFENATSEQLLQIVKDASFRTALQVDKQLLDDHATQRALELNFNEGIKGMRSDIQRELKEGFKRMKITINNTNTSSEYRDKQLYS